MEKTRLFLTNYDEELYVIKVSRDSDPSFGQGIYFAHDGRGFCKTLEEVIEWGRELAKNLKTTLEIDEELRIA